MDIEKLQETARRFIDERDWRQFQTLKELAINASVESNELLELFQWQEGKDIDKKLLSGEDKATMDKIKKETADVFFSCLAIADHAGFDMGKVFLEKIEELEKRYQKDKVKGKVVKIPSND
ncbi:hypothetical protein M1293_00055 [Candidatus Parvarchaeota archaeon]|nr:hypothetical protein [Candidatus Parvarchaeota archaeon]